MLCEFSFFHNFFATWALVCVLALVGMTIVSGTLFYIYYVNPSYDKWRWKSNPKFPSPGMVRDEILFMLKGLGSAALCPALALWLGTKGYSKAYCGCCDPEEGQQTLPVQIAMFFFIWIFSDFCEFFYHRLGHVYRPLWKQHKYHHKFYNPSPFAVIADDYVDQFARASLLLVLPLIMRVNMDVMFGTYATFFYGYGVFLHWGFESRWDALSAHSKWVNTAFQHYLHHARSIFGKPYHTGFFFKVWDNMFGSVWKDECFCVRCEQAKGNRTREQYDKIEKPDYSVLLSPQFWLHGPPSIVDAIDADDVDAVSKQKAL